MDDTNQTVKNLKSKASDLADDARDALAGTAHDHAAGARDEAVRHADATASAAHAASQEFDPNSLQAAALREVGGYIESLTGGLRDRPVNELVDDVALFARRNPLIFLGGAAVLGFAAARFLKASDPHSQAYDDHDPWNGHLAAPARVSAVGDRPKAPNTGYAGGPTNPQYDAGERVQ